ncbi:MAG: TonB family protein, partial [Bacteroidales bacterium]|nr:TonB family protein [Bacteroidales bacterium]
IIVARYAIQTLSVLRTLRRAEVTSQSEIRLVRTSDCLTPFSFFSCVFVNPSVTEAETREIMNHEAVHVRQKHWFDLLLSSLLCTLQWFNPVAWIYSRFIRQNHEYLADEVALQHTSDPVIYRAALLNQIAGSPVFDLSNSFNYSLNKKRFNMMKNIVTSPYRKLRLLLILPLLALIMFAFAEPEYKVASTDTGASTVDRLPEMLTGVIKGVVVSEDGTPLEGAAIILKGTTTGTVSDQKGRFMLENVPDDGLIVISYVGFVSKVMKPQFGKDVKVTMERATVMTDTVNVPPPPPPPPPPAGVKVVAGVDMSKVLIVLDGAVTEKDLSTIDPETIHSINVIKDESAVILYGEKGRNGVIEITTKAKASQAAAAKSAAAVAVSAETTGEDVFVVVEEMPEFPGGQDAMRAWIGSNIKYPAGAAKEKVTGTVVVDFIVTSTGKIKNVKTIRSVNPLLDAEAERVIGLMPDWHPGHQRGKAVDVKYTVPVKFSLD